MTRHDLRDEILLALRCTTQGRRWQHASHARDCALRLCEAVEAECAAMAATTEGE